MDDAHRIRLAAITEKAKLHDEFVKKETVPISDEAETKDYLIGWTKFKAELADLNEDAVSPLTWVQDARIEVAEHDLDSQVTRYNTLATKIQLRKEQENAAILEELLKKKKAGQKLTLSEEEILKAAQAAASHEAPVKVAPSPITGAAPPKAPKPEDKSGSVSWGTIAIVAGAGAVFLVLAIGASGAGRELGRETGAAIRERLRKKTNGERMTWNEYFERGKGR